MKQSTGPRSQRPKTPSQQKPGQSRPPCVSRCVHILSSRGLVPLGEPYCVAGSPPFNRRKGYVGGGRVAWCDLPSRWGPYISGRSVHYGPADRSGRDCPGSLLNKEEASHEPVHLRNPLRDNLRVFKESRLVPRLWVAPIRSWGSSGRAGRRALSRQGRSQPRRGPAEAS